MFLEIIWYNHSAHLMGRPRYTKGIFYHSFHGWYSILLPLPLDCCVLWCLALLSGVSLANITSPVHSVDRRRFKHSISQSFLCVMESMACRGVVKVFWVVRPDIVAVALQVEVPLLQVATRVGMTIVAPSTCLKSHVTFYRVLFLTVPTQKFLSVSR